jgi:hypothetical protein
LMQIKVKVVGEGKPEDPFRVNLPTYHKIGEIKDGMATVEVPDDELTDGKPDAEKIRKKYKGNPVWDREDLKDVLP